MSAEAKSAPLHRLTNLDISNDYRGVSMLLMRKDFTSQFARWVVQQSPYPCPDIMAALVEFDAYVLDMMEGEEVKQFSYDDLQDMIAENVFEKIPAVLALNVAAREADMVLVTRHSQPHPDYDFIDLGALARNVFYSIVRSHINWAD